MLKKKKGESTRKKRRFQKGAGILNSVKVHGKVSLEIRLSRASNFYAAFCCASLRNSLDRDHNGEYNYATKRKMQELQPNKGNG